MLKNIQNHETRRYVQLPMPFHDWSSMTYNRQHQNADLLHDIVKMIHFVQTYVTVVTQKNVVDQLCGFLQASFSCRKQCAKKVVSDSLGLMDFAIGLVNSVRNLPNRRVTFLGEFKLQKNCNQSCSSYFFRLVEMTFGQVNTRHSLPEWQAVKLTFLICTLSFITKNPENSVLRRYDIGNAERII